MMTTVFAGVLVIHALLHLIGFSQELNLGYANKFKYRYSWLNRPNVKRAMGIGWFVACTGLLSTAYFYFIHEETLFDIVGVASLILSQTLIIFYWAEAKFGTLINWVLLLALVISFLSHGIA